MDNLLWTIRQGIEICQTDRIQLKAYSPFQRGQHLNDRKDEGTRLFVRTISAKEEMDPNFPVAHSRLGAYKQAGQYE